MTSEQMREKAEEYVLHTYNRFPVVFTEGHGMYLYDADGKEYLDFAAGIAVHAIDIPRRHLFFRLTIPRIIRPRYKAIIGDQPRSISIVSASL